MHHGPVTGSFPVLHCATWSSWPPCTLHGPYSSPRSFPNMIPRSITARTWCAWQVIASHAPCNEFVQLMCCARSARDCLLTSLPHAGHILVIEALPKHDSNLKNNENMVRVPWNLLTCRAQVASTALRCYAHSSLPLWIMISHKPCRLYLGC